jgi:Asp-tRNA(Asn)/Glu-tRNA(Gln) amidotransferase A subunit family amidase
MAEREKNLWAGEVVARCPVGVPDGPYLQQAAPRVRESFEAMVGRLKSAGVDVRRVPMLGEFDLLKEAHSVIMHYETARNHVLSGRWPRYAALYRAGTAALIDRGLGLSEAEYNAALSSRVPAADRVREAMERAGVLALLTPGATDVAPEGASNRWWTGDAGMQAVWTMFGWPVLSLPTGLVGGLPVGVQLVMPHGKDESLLRLGLVLGTLSTSSFSNFRARPVQATWPWHAARRQQEQGGARPVPRGAEVLKCTQMA